MRSPRRRLKRAKSVLIMHDLYPDVLVMAGLLKPGSLVAESDARDQRADVSRARCRRHHRRDTEKLLLRYGE